MQTIPPDIPSSQRSLRALRSAKSTSTKVVIYRPDSRMQHPARLMREMVRDLLASRDLAWQLMIRNISAKYRQSLLGVFWAFIPPVVMSLSFTLAQGSGVFNVGKINMPYPAYVMISMALWQTFVESLNGPIQAMTAAKPMLSRVNFPREALVLAKLGEVFFNFGIKLILIVGVFLWFKIPITVSIVLAPVALIHLILLGTFLGVMLSPLGMLYQDLSMSLTMITGFWLFITPVVYPVPTTGVFGAIVKLNPVTPLLVTTRELATTGVLSESTGFWISSAIAIIGMLGAWLFYRLAMPFVVERISS
jgi:lipopolysaccharide transport system permease protein